MLAWSQRNEWIKYQETCKRGTFCALQKRGKNHFLWVNERAVLKTTRFHKNTTHATSIMLQPNIIAAPCLQHNKPICWKAKSTCAAQKERKKKNHNKITVSCLYCFTDTQPCFQPKTQVNPHLVLVSVIIQLLFPLFLEISNESLASLQNKTALNWRYSILSNRPRVSRQVIKLLYWSPMWRGGKSSFKCHRKGDCINTETAWTLICLTEMVSV